MNIPWLQLIIGAAVGLVGWLTGTGGNFLLRRTAAPRIASRTRLGMRQNYNVAQSENLTIQNAQVALQHSANMTEAFLKIAEKNNQSIELAKEAGQAELLKKMFLNPSGIDQTAETVPEPPTPTARKQKFVFDDDDDKDSSTADEVAEPPMRTPAQSTSNVKTVKHTEHPSKALAPPKAPKSRATMLEERMRQIKEMKDLMERNQTPLETRHLEDVLFKKPNEKRAATKRNPKG